MAVPSANSDRLISRSGFSTSRENPRLLCILCRQLIHECHEICDQAISSQVFMYYSCTWLVRPVPKSSQARRKLKNVIRYDYIKVFPWLALISLFWSSLILVMLKLRSFAYSTICGVFMYGHLRSKGRCHATTISQGGESVHSFPANDDVGTCCLHDLCSRKFTISATTIRPCARFDYEDSFLLRAIGEVH